MKNANFKNIVDVSEMLMSFNGKFDMLQVKEELFNLGFNTDTRLLKESLVEIAALNGWVGDYNGTFDSYKVGIKKESNEKLMNSILNAASDKLNKKYQLDSTFQKNVEEYYKQKIDELRSPKTKKIESKEEINSYVSRNGRLIVPLCRRFTKSGDWVITSKLSNRVMYFTKDLTRNEVIEAFCKINNISNTSNLKIEKTL